MAGRHPRYRGHCVLSVHSTFKYERQSLPVVSSLHNQFSLYSLAMLDYITTYWERCSNLEKLKMKYTRTSLIRTSDIRAPLSTGQPFRHLVNMHCPIFKSIINHNSSNHYHVILFFDINM